MAASRDALDARVGWTGVSGTAGLTDAEAVMALFGRVCMALRTDEAQPAPDTARALLRVGAAPP